MVDQRTVRFRFPTGSVNRFNRRYLGASGALETAEVMGAHKHGSRFVHFLHVRSFFHLPRIVARKRIRLRRIPDAVLVFFPAGVLAGVKTRLRFFGTQRPDIFRQDTVQRPRQVRGGNRPLCGKGNHLAAGMHPRIRPAAAGNGYRFAANAGQFFFQNLLYGYFLRLPLEAEIVASVVADSEFYRSHITTMLNNWIIL